MDSQGPAHRQIVLDTETTGLDVTAGHRIIELGCVELVNRRPTRRTFHRYVNPQRKVDAGALEVHGIDDEFLAVQPLFADIADEFLDFVAGAELVIHNADFDVGFINHELKRLDGKPADIAELCAVLDTLALARQLHPGQRNSLDALAKRYAVDNSKRDLHGALLDAQILADVYLTMTGGQTSLLPESGPSRDGARQFSVDRVERAGLRLRVSAVSPQEEESHVALMEKIRAQSTDGVVWDRIQD